MARQPMMMVCCGRRATGKSVETIQTMYGYVNGTPSKNIKGRKALIFDVNNEFGTFDFKGETHSIRTLPLSYLSQFCHPTSAVQIRRIPPYFEDGERMTSDDMSKTLIMILKDFKNGVILIEDINKYVSDTPKADIIGSIATLRQSGNDAIVHYQNIGRVGNPKILGNTNIIRLHKTNDSVAKHASKFEDKVDILSIAEKIVNTKYYIGMKHNLDSKDPEEKKLAELRFSYVYINLDFNKIQGEFTKQEAQNAIQDYVAENYSKLMRPYLNKFDRNTGKKIHDKKTAYSQIERDFLDTYFDF